MSTGAGSDSGSSLGGFGAALEAELLRAQSTEEEEESSPRKRQRLGEPAQAADPAALCPPHPGFLGGMCIRCAAVKSERDEEERGDGGGGPGTHVQLSYLSSGLEVRSDVVAQLRSDELRRVLAQRKLLLVLDLDHTLLNSARAQDVDAASLEALHAATHTEMQRPGGPELYELKFMRMWTKLRPGARALLAAASPLCEVLVYTMGDRAYAAEMARLLDPQGLLLRAGRVISAGDSTKSGVKDLDVVLGDARAVLVLDDTRGVWPRHSENVIVPDRYHYFPSSASAHGGAAAASLLAQGRDESEAEGTLAALSRLIARVHCAFFAGADAERLGDVRHHLRCQRVQVLAGCVLVFSGLIPQGSDAEKHPLWRLAVELGATASTDQRADGTHLVTPAMGTEKGRWAAREGLLCVKPAWLHACSARWEHTAEEPYLPG